MEKIKCSVFDVDGTISDCAWRTFLVDGREKNFERFHKMAKYDDPIKNTVDILRKQYAIGYHIMILTGRTNDYKPQLVQWLEGNRIPWDSIIMRKIDDKSPAYDFKIDAMKRNGDKYDYQYFYDDCDGNCEAVGREFKNCCTILV